MQKPTGLKPQDVLVATKLFSLHERPRPSSDYTLASLSSELGISTSEVHNSLGRCERAQIVRTVGDVIRVMKNNLLDLVVYATPRIFYAVRGPIEEGIPTGIFAESLKEKFEAPKLTLPTVWKTEGKGLVRGESLIPIYPSVPEAAQNDPHLYELLSLIEIVRMGDSRYKKMAVGILEKRILGKETNDK